jgi:KUP system potassium uptake protein
MEYTTNELVKDKVIRIDFKLGFRVQPRINLLFKMVIQEMFRKEEICVVNKYESLDQKTFHADITFVIIETFLSVESELSVKEGFIMDSYFAIKNFAQSDQKAFGLDNASTVMESVPLVINPKVNLPLRRTMMRTTDRWQI